MKTKFYWLALLASAALIAQAQAGGHHGGGGGGGGSSGGGGGHFGGGGGRFSGGGGHFGGGGGRFSGGGHFGGGGRFAAPGPRFSAMGGRSSANAFRQYSIGGGPAIGTRQFTPGDFNRGGGVTRFADRGNRPGQIAGPTGERSGAIQNQTGGNGLTRSGNNRQDRLAQLGNGAGGRNGAVRNRGGQVRNGNNLPANWRNHIAGQRSANWQRGWDRGRDHFWNGHRCRFVDGSWFIFDFGFPWYPYGYPYDYYADDYYPYEYDAGVYEGGDPDYYSQGAYDSSQQDADSTVAAAQTQLSRQGYYRGEIDGIFGAATRSAIMRYQRERGLRVTGLLNMDTQRALGLPRVASN